MSKSRISFSRPGTQQITIYDDKKKFFISSFAFYCTSAKIKVVSVDERERTFIAIHNSRCAHTNNTSQQKGGDTNF